MHSDVSKQRQDSPAKEELDVGLCSLGLGFPIAQGTVSNLKTQRYEARPVPSGMRPAGSRRTFVPGHGGPAECAGRPWSESGPRVASCSRLLILR